MRVEQRHGFGAAIDFSVRAKTTRILIPNGNPQRTVSYGTHAAATERRSYRSKTIEDRRTTPPYHGRLCTSTDDATAGAQFVDLLPPDVEQLRNGQ